MGILTTYLAYKYGKSRAQDRLREDYEAESEICVDCGYPRALHANDANESCPQISY